MIFKAVKKRLLALLLAVLLTISVIPAFSSQEALPASEEETLPKSEGSAGKPEAGATVRGLKYIDDETLEKQGAIERLSEKETLNSYTFLNSDGTESVVMFPDNIKYIDESGAVIEKDISLIETGSGGYMVKDNDYDVIFPGNIKDGLSFAYSGGSIKLMPKNAEGVAVTEENSVLYANVFGENTILRYTPLLNGVKEDVILNEYTGLSSFEFKLTTDKLSLSEKDGRFVFGNEREEPVLEFGDVFAYDSS